MAIDTLKWLKEDLGFTEDEAKALLPQFETRAEKLEKGFLRQSDYSKHMNDLKKTQDTLAAAEAKLNADMAEWAEMTAAEKAEAGDLKTKIDAAEAKIFSLTQKATRLAEDAGVDPKTILGDEVIPPKKEPSPTAFDPGPLQQQIGGIAEYMLTLNAELPAIAEEHFQLTGERLDTRKFIGDIKAAIATGKAKPADLDPVKRWESTYDIPAKRQAKAVEKHDAEIKAAEERGRLAAASEMALPNNGMRPGTHSPVFKTSNVAQGSKLQRPQPSDRLSGAINALRNGTYRQGGPGKAA